MSSQKRKKFSNFISNPTLTLGGTPQTYYVNKPFIFTPLISGNNGSGIKYNVTGLPQGAVLNQTTGALSGIVTEAGEYDVTLEAVQSGTTVSQQYTLVFCNDLTLKVQSAEGYINVPFTLNPITYYTGREKLVFSATNLPPGLSLNSSTGSISGNPTTEGYWVVNFSVTDGVVTKNANFRIDISYGVALSGTPTPAYIGEYYQFVPVISGINPQSAGTQTTLLSGTIPPGCELVSRNGSITGVPTTIGSYSYELQITDGYSTNKTLFEVTVEQQFALEGFISIGVCGVPYTFTLKTIGAGNSTPSFKIVKGTLPYGLVFDPTSGVISGVPYQNGIYAFTVIASLGNKVSAYDYQLQITLPVNNQNYNANTALFIAYLKDYMHRVSNSQYFVPTVSDHTNYLQLTQANQCLRQATFCMLTHFTEDVKEFLTETLSDQTNLAYFTPEIVNAVLTSNLEPRPKLITMWNGIYNAFLPNGTPILKSRMLISGATHSMIAYLKSIQSTTQSSSKGG